MGQGDAAAAAVDRQHHVQADDGHRDILGQDAGGELDRVDAP
jgi:hypothetical protein